MITVDSIRAQSSGTPLILAGHSHIVALVDNRDCTPPEVRKLNVGTDTFTIDGTWPRDDAYWAQLAEAAKDSDVALMWGGNEHNSCYFFQEAYQFDFLSTYVNKIMPSMQIVPRNRIAKRFNELTLNDLDAVLASLRDAGARSITLLGTPSPKKDSEALRAMLPSEPFFVDWAKSIGTSLEDIKITLPHVRLKLWYLLQEMLQAAAARVNARFIPVPAESQDEEGYLLPAFWAQDITHANGDYGQLMLRNVLKELGHE